MKNGSDFAGPFAELIPVSLPQCDVLKIASASVEDALLPSLARTGSSSSLVLTKSPNWRAGKVSIFNVIRTAVCLMRFPSLGPMVCAMKTTAIGRHPN